MTIYIPSCVMWYVLGLVSPFVLIILWVFAGKIAARFWGKDENSPDK